MCAPCDDSAMIRYRAGREPSASGPRLAFGLLSDVTDRRVHAVYEVADPCPLSLCGWHVLADIYFDGDAVLCRGCLAALPDDAELRAACTERRLSAHLDYPGLLVAVARFERWWWARRFDRRIRRAIAEQWRRG